MFTYGAAMRKLVRTQEFEYLYTHRGHYNSPQARINTYMFHVSILSRYVCPGLAIVQLY